MPDPRAVALLAWYERVRRPLPWRATRDPYALLVSEVMLQQTQALRVVPYYERWLALFPDPKALARASSRELLAAWSGLGYNRRALALQRACSVVAEQGWPDDLSTLPGVGPYTAAAVASFAWDHQLPAVDTNARRVVDRWDGRADPRNDRAARERAAELLPMGLAATYNQAMMELGATICTARRADCGNCPVAEHCASAHRVVPLPRRRGAGVRFEDTERYVRGRIVAALAAGEPLPELDPARVERALVALERDGLVVRANNEVRLP